MNDTPEPELTETSGTYRTCTACHCKVHRDLERCPECGAYPGEHYPSRFARKTGKILKVLLVLFLAAALYLLSRDREEARQAELEEITVLSPTGSSLSASDPVPATVSDEPEVTERPDSGPSDVNPFAPPRPEPTPTEDPFAPPRPEPTPAEARPVIPTPTPIPIPTATPLPAPTPTPSVLDEKEKVKTELSQALDQQAPLAQPGDVVRLTLQNGQQIEGTLLQTAPSQFKIDSERGSQWIPYRQLNLQSRLQVDARERDAFLEEKALEQILNRL